MSDLCEVLNQSMAAMLTMFGWKLNEAGAWTSPTFTCMEELDTQNYFRITLRLPDNEDKASEVEFRARLEHFRATARYDIVWPWKVEGTRVSCVMARRKFVRQ